MSVFAEPLTVVDSLTAAERVLIIDVSNLAHRSAWAYKDLTLHDGTPSGHVFGSTRLLISHLSNDFGPSPTLLVFAYDGRGARARRQEILPAYKATRDSDGRLNPVPQVKEVFRHIPGLHIEAEGFEGDDVIAAMAEIMSKRGKQTILLTADRDMWALMRHPGVRVFSPSKKRFVTLEDIEEEYLTPDPAKIPLVKAIFGDKSDGISGVFRLLRAHVKPTLNVDTVVDVDTFFAQAERSEIPPKTMAKLAESRAAIETNLKVIQPIQGIGVQHVNVVKSTDLNRSYLNIALLNWGCQSLPAQTGIFFGDQTFVKEK